MEEYKSNSHKSRQNQNDDIPEKRVEKVVSGSVKSKKKNGLQKITNVFVPEDVDDVKSYIFEDIVVPAVKDIILDAVRAFLGVSGNSRVGRSSTSSKISYRKYYDDRDRRDSGNVSRTRTGYDYDDIILESRGEAEDVLERMDELIATSHELMTVNEKFKSTYSNRFKCFLFMGTNKPVKITDAKSGLIRRLIDVSPSGNKLNPKEYKTIVKQVEFELGAIAYRCQEVYLSNPGRYDDYIPITMLGASNDFYNFIIDSYHVFKKENGTTLKAAWEMYKTYCDDAKVGFPFSQRVFKEELKNYFHDFQERFNLDDGTRVRSYYIGFRTEKFEEETVEEKPEVVKPALIQFDSTESIFDDVCSECPAQYASENETPQKKWDSVCTKLSGIDTKKLHYVKVPENHIVIDFDIPDESGNKSFEKNLAEASKWPPTYAELSKSGQGIHLHYIYTGDPTQLSRVYDDHVEVKVFTGKSSLRRMLSKCNNLPIATISSGLPLKGEQKMVNFEAIKSEKGLRTLIKRNLNKEIHPGTKPSIDFIYKILEDAYGSDLKYDVTDMRNAVLAFAANSTHQADYCIKLVNKMQFKSADPSTAVKNDDAKLVFYDIEVFPNLFLVNWKIEGEGKPVVRMINPSPSEIEELMRFRLVGFNCRRYDNHILYARLMSYTNEQLYNLSQKIINGSNDYQRWYRTSLVQSHLDAE